MGRSRRADRTSILLTTGRYRPRYRIPSSKNGTLTPYHDLVSPKSVLTLAVKSSFFLMTMQANSPHSDRVPALSCRLLTCGGRELPNDVVCRDSAWNRQFTHVSCRALPSRDKAPRPERAMNAWHPDPNHPNRQTFQNPSLGPSDGRTQQSVGKIYE
jgi:hypothetical protein